MLLPNLCTSVQSVGVFVGGYGIPAIPTPPSDIPPTEFTEFTEASGVGYSPTDFTDAHRFLGCVLPPNLCTSVQSVGVFVGGYGILPYPRHPLKSSHRIHRIHRSFWRRIFSHRFRRFSQIFRLRFCLLICAHPCLSVGGFLCQNVLCVLRILWDTLSPSACLGAW